MKNIVLTGGGTAGHVTPNIALMPALEKEGYRISYIGSRTGIEKELIKALKVDYYEISCGKLRRYFDLKNATDAFRVIKGVADAYIILRKVSADVVFSKGGFVSVPVVIAAHLRHIPVIIHESDLTPGLANKIAMPFADKICTAFPETIKLMPKGKAVFTGTPIRRLLFNGSRQKGLEYCGFNSEKPVLMVIGGSQGSVKINEAVRKALPMLIRDYQIIHICGRNNLDNDLLNVTGYRQFEYISRELPDIFAAADIIISRAGANAINEFAALKKPALLIPLSKQASRGDQIDNAKSFEKRGFSHVLLEEELSSDSLVREVKRLYENRESLIAAMKKMRISGGVREVINEIKSF